MLSVPKDYTENLRFRAKLLAACDNDPVVREATKKLFFESVIFAFNAFFYTLDVRRRPQHHQPFCTYPFQDETILTIREHVVSGKDLLIEKSRDMGCSWMVILVYLHLWLDPAGGADFLLGSRIEDYVDKKGDMRTLLQKARYAFYRLPKWLWPAGFNPKKHDNFMRLQNPQTGSSITGESNNPNWSTGGRYISGLLDEFAKWESTDEAAWTSAGDATPCRIALSTPFGAGGKYYDLRCSSLIDKLTLHWSLHPVKAEGLCCVWPKPEEAGAVVDQQNWVGLSSPWYLRETSRRSSTEISQELDIDYVGSGSPVFDGRAGKRLGALLRTETIPAKVLSVDLLSGCLQLDSGFEPDSEEDKVLVFEEPSIEESYIVAVDVAEGKEDGDFSIVKVLNRRTESCAATFFSKLDEVQLADVVNLIARYYTVIPERAPWWAVEANGPGLATFDLIAFKHDLPNAFMMPQFETSKESVTYRKGWWTTTNSRRELVAGIKKWLIEGTGWTNLRCVKEMTTFVKSKTGKAEAKTGTHDDEVLCWGIALMVNSLVPNEEVYERPKLLRENSISEMLLKPEPMPITSLEELCFQQAMARQQLARELTFID